MHLVRKLFAASLFAVSAPIAATADTVDVDLVFVIDQSGSMANEFATLASDIDVLFNGLLSSSEVSSVSAGLVTYEAARNGASTTGLTLQQSLDSDAANLSTAFAAVGVFGGTEDALSAVDAVLPGGELFTQLAWRNDTVKSVILITDENADDASIYSNSFGTGYAALGAKLDDVGYLNNIITTSSLFASFEPASAPRGTAGEYQALFDIADFTGPGSDSSVFLSNFASSKLGELTTVGTETGGSDMGVVPLPAAGWLLLAGIGGINAISRRRRRAA